MLAIALVACRPDPASDAVRLHIGGADRARHSVPAFGGIVATDGARVAAADVDGDRVEVRGLEDGRSRWVILPEGSVPGPIALADGVLHVLTRASGRLLEVDVSRDGAPVLLDDVPVCDAPRGLAVDAEVGRTWVVCADGQLVGVGEGDVVRHRLPADLRDVVPLGDGRALVSVFRTAEILSVDLVSGAVLGRWTPPTSTEGRFQARAARRMVASGDGAVLVYQEHANDPIEGIDEAAYAGGGVVGTTTTEIGPDGEFEVRHRADGGIRLDLAVGPAGVYGLAEGTDDGTLITTLSGERPPFDTAAVASGIAVTDDGRVFVATRDPYGLVDVALGGEVVAQSSGLALFQQAPNGIACASCHPDGGDDGHVWLFVGDGARKTMALGGGLLETAPFHWDGALADMGALYSAIGVGRMGLPSPVGDQVEVLAAWLDDLPVAPTGAAERDDDAIARGYALFDSADVGCTACHAPPTWTSPGSYDVGTGGTFQVPSLRSVSARLPVMHDGCAETLLDRFTDPSCGGGDAHGQTSQLASDDLDDLVAYLSSL